MDNNEPKETDTLNNKKTRYPVTPKSNRRRLRNQQNNRRNRRNNQNDEQQYISLGTKIMKLIIKITRNCTKKNRPR